MSAATQTFMQIVQDTDDEDRTVIPPANTFMRFCEVCMEVMPHYREETYCQCVECETKSYRRRKSEQGQALVEVALWIVVVVCVVLFVLHNRPW